MFSIGIRLETNVVFFFISLFELERLRENRNISEKQVLGHEICIF